MRLPAVFFTELEKVIAARIAYLDSLAPPEEKNKMTRCADCNDIADGGNCCEECLAPLCGECGELCDACFIAEVKAMAEEEGTLP